MNHTQLQQAALGVICTLGQYPQYSNLKIAVIGGLARVHYHPTGRPTEDVNFIVDTSEMSLAEEIKQAVLQHGVSFYQPTDILYYRHQPPNGDVERCRVNFIERDKCPYLPTGAQRVQDIPIGHIPYIGLEDAIVFKIYSCGLRGTVNQGWHDALDAEALPRTAPMPLALTPGQRSVAQSHIGDILRFPVTRSFLWWKVLLGI